MLRIFTFHLLYQNAKKSRCGSSKGRIRSDSGGPDGDGGHEAAAQGAFLTVTEEEVTAAGGAQIADENII